MKFFWGFLVMVVLLVGSAGCIRIPSPAQTARLGEIRVRRAALQEAGKQLVLDLKAGTIALPEFIEKGKALWAEEKAIEAEEKAIVDAGAPLWSVIANGLLVVLIGAFGGKRNLRAVAGKVAGKVVDVIKGN